MVYRSVLALLAVFSSSLIVFGQPLLPNPVAVRSVSYFEGPVASFPEAISYGWRSVMSGDGTRVAMNYGSWNGAGETRIFDVKSGETLYQFPSLLGARAIASLPSGEQFAIGDFSGNFTVRNFSNGEIVHQWKLPKGSIESISFNRDGTKAYIGSNADFAAQIDTKTGEISMLYEGHDQVVFDARLSQDGSLLATSSMNGKVIVYKHETGVIVQSLSHPGQVAAIAWVGARDQLVSISSDGRICIWNVNSGELVKEVKTPTSLYSVDVDDAAKTIVTGGQGTVRFWNAATLEPISSTSSGVGDAEPFSGHSWLVFGAQFVGSDKVLTSGWDQKMFLWDRTTGKPLREFEKTDPDLSPVVALQSDPDMKIGYVARNDSSITQVDLATFRPISSLVLKDDRKVAAICLGSDGQLLIATHDGFLDQVPADLKDVSPNNLRRIATLSEPPIAMKHLSNSEIILMTASGNLMRLNRENGKILQTIPLAGDVTGVAWSGPRGVVLTRKSKETVAYEFEVNSQGEWGQPKPLSTRLLPGSPSNILPVSESKMIFVQAPNQPPTQPVVQPNNVSVIYDTKTFQTVGFVSGLIEVPSAFSISRDGSVLLVGTTSGKLQLYQTQVPQINPIANVLLPFGELRFASFLKDGSSIRIGSKEGQFVTLSSKDLSLLEEPIQLPRFGLASASRPKERNFVAAGSFGGDAIVLNFDNFEVLCQLSTHGLKSSGQAGAVALSDDRKHLVVGTNDGVVRSYEVASGKLNWASENFGAPINDVSFSPDEKLVVASAGDYRLMTKGGLTTMLESNNGKTVVKWEESGHMITGVRFSPDGTKLLSCGNDKLRTYDVANQVLLHAATDVVGCKRIQFVDNHRCIVVSFPGNIRLWNTSTNRVVARYSGHVKAEGNSSQPMVWAIDVSEDGKFLITGDLPGQLYLWPIP